MKRMFLLLSALVSVSSVLAQNYSVTVRHVSMVDLVRENHSSSDRLRGKSIGEIVGPIAEVRIEVLENSSILVANGEMELPARIRERIDRAKCFGRQSEVRRNMAPWLNGYLLLKNGRIVPIEIMLGGIVVDDLLFDE